MVRTKEITKFLEKSLKVAAKELGKTAQQNFNFRVQRFLRILFRQVLIVGLFTLAFIFFIIALLFAGIEYLNLTMTISLIIVGFIVLFAALILKSFKSKED